MQNLSQHDLRSTDGGYWKLILKGLTAGISFAIGQDIEKEWRDAWNDPYGRD